MESISPLLDQWTLNKISQYKQDQLKMTLEDAQSTNIYELRDNTIAFLTQYVINKTNNPATV